MKTLIKATAIAAFLATALPAHAAGLSGLPSAANIGLDASAVTSVGFKKRGFRSRSFNRTHGFSNRRSGRHAKRNFYRNYRAFDRARIYTDGPAVGPSGHRKLRPEFRDGRAFSLFGRRAR